MHAHSHSRNESWPKPDDSIDEVELNKIKYQAQVDEIAANRRNALDGEKRRAEADIALEKADWDAEYQLDAQYHSAVMDVAKAAIERARSGAELVQKSAAAIGTAYAALLALSFSVANNPLPPRGAIPGIFLGLSIVLSTAYVAFITKPDHVAKGSPRD
jgi:hypothetical protein